MRLHNQLGGSFLSDSLTWSCDPMSPGIKITGYFPWKAGSSESKLSAPTLSFSDDALPATLAIFGDAFRAKDLIFVSFGNSYSTSLRPASFKSSA